MSKKVFPRYLFPVLMLVFILFGSAACEASTPAPTQATVSGQEPVQAEPTKGLEPTKAPEVTNTSEPTKTLEPTKTPEPTRTPEPTATSVPTPIGLSRENPFPSADIVSAPNWDIQVVEIKKGEEAWKDLLAANMFNQTAPEGMEYILVKIHAKSTYTDSDAHSIGRCDFEATGDRFINYNCFSALVVNPDPELDAELYSGGEAEGWLAFVVDKGEGNLILVFDEGINFDPDTRRYIALDDGASIQIPSDLANIEPTDAGKDRNASAPMTEKIITDDWEINIIDVIRGEEAWQMVLEANQFNDPPQDGFEYMVVKVHVHNISTDENPLSMDGMFFKSTGSAGALYDSPILVDPEPQLGASLYPGGETEGWVILQAKIGETDMKLVFDSLFDFGGENKRFISLEP